MTPRPYLSYTQLTLLERSPEKYKEIYINGGTGFTNTGMEFGSKVAEALEDGEATGDPELDFVLSAFPAYELKEEEIHADLVDHRKKIPLIAKLDSVSTDYDKVLEYKTGTTKWNQSKVDQSDQLTYYATVIYLKTNKIPKLKLVWLETEKMEDGRIRILSQHLKEFETKRTTSDLLLMMIRMKKAWEKIQQLSQEALL